MTRFCSSVQYATDLKECPSEWNITRCNPCANKHWHWEEAANRRRRDVTQYDSGENFTREFTPKYLNIKNS